MATVVLELGVEVVELYMLTDLNHKLKCDGFLHISVPPVSGKSYASIVNEGKVCVFKLRDGSNSSQPMKLIDLVKYKLSEVPECMTLASHGMTKIEFMKWWCAEHPKSGADGEVCCYYYKRVGG